MRQLFLAIVAIVSAYTAGCQSLSVAGFSLLESDMTARTIAPERDANGDLTALIRVVSTASGFVFEGGSLGIVKADQRVGEWWVYVPDGARTITIRHPQLGVLRNYAYPVPVRGGSTYELALVHGNVELVVREREILTEFVVINTEPSGADVYLNNEPVGKTPFATDKPEGRYEWRVERNLYLPQAGVFDLVPGEQVRLDLELIPDFGSVYVSSYPEQGATITLNGLDVGKTTPATLERLPTGEHTLVLSHQWYGTVTKKITVKAGEQITETLTMSPTFGDVTVAAANDEEVFVNGGSKGKGTWNGRLAPGVYQIEVRKPSHKSAKRQLAIKSGDIETLELSPEPIYSSLRVVSEPLDAEIFLNGVSYGTAPKIIRDLLVGSYELELRKPSFGIYRTNIEVVEKQMNEVNGVLTSMGVISVSSTTPEAGVYLNGDYRGMAPATLTDLKPGTYKIEVKKAGYDTFTKSVYIEPGSKEQLNVTLSEAASSITVNSSPSSAKIYVDGNYRGLTPQRIDGFSAGNYDLELQRDGYKPVKRRLYIKSDEHRKMNFDLSPNRATRVANQYSYGGLGFSNKAFRGNTRILALSMMTLNARGAGGYGDIVGLGFDEEWEFESYSISGGVTFKLVYPFWGYIGGGFATDYDEYFSLFPETGVFLGLFRSIVLRVGTLYQGGEFYTQWGFAFEIG